MQQKKIILLKLTGEIFSDNLNNFDSTLIESILNQIGQLRSNYQFSIVVGGGNVIRGYQYNKKDISSINSHYIGILSTMINGLILQDLCHKHNLKTTLFSALECPQIGLTISPQNIITAKNEADCIIFSGGTGNPYFTTDTNAVLRALQINAIELWKGTKVDGIYTKDPKKYQDAALLKSTTHRYAIEQRLNVMDLAAFTLAEQNHMLIRIFNIFSPNALIEAAKNNNYGSTIN